MLYIGDVNESFETIDKTKGKEIKRIYWGMEPSGTLHLGHYNVLNEINLWRKKDPSLEIIIYIASSHSSFNSKKDIERKVELSKKFFSLVLPDCKVVQGDQLFNDLQYYKNFFELLEKVKVNDLLRSFPLERKHVFKKDLKNVLKQKASLLIYGLTQAVDPHFLDVDLFIAGQDQRNIYSLVYDFYTKLNWNVPSAVFCPLLDCDLKECRSSQNLQDIAAKKQSSSGRCIALDYRLYETICAFEQKKPTIFDHFNSDSIVRNFKVSSKEDFVSKLKEFIYPLYKEKFSFK